MASQSPAKSQARAEAAEESEQITDETRGSNRERISNKRYEDNLKPECEGSLGPSNDEGGDAIADANSMNGNGSGSGCDQIAQPNTRYDAIPSPSSKSCEDHINIETAKNFDLVDELVANYARKTGSKAERNARSHPKISARDFNHSASHAEGFPSNGELRLIPRQCPPSKGPTADKFWYSPIMKYRFRSKKEVNKYLECLKSVNGDEVKAIYMFHGCGWEETCRSITRDTPSALESSLHMKVSPLKVVEFIEPSRLLTRKEEAIDTENEDAKHDSQKRADCDTDVRTNVYSKPIIKKGERVYACWKGRNRLGRGWFPGRVWDVKEITPGEYGPERKYDVLYDDGDTESNMDEIWVMKKDEYELGVMKPEEQWIGVTNVTFPKSNDQYAKLIGWYKLTCDGAHQVYSSLGDALRSHDKVS
jgi:hypothetical protein